MIFKSRTAISLLLFAILVRGGVAWLSYGDLAADPDSYSRLAITWAKSGTFGFEGEQGVTPTAFRPPLYPWLLSWCVDGASVSRSGIAILHVLLGSATVVLTYLIGCRLQLRAAWVAAVAVAIDPILLRQSQLVMTETLATFLAVLAWWLWLVGRSAVEKTNSKPSDQSSRRSATQLLAIIGFGLVLGVSILARPTAAPWAAMCALAALAPLPVGRNSWKQRFTDCALICLGVLVCVAPWTMRNQALLGKPVWATTHGGYTLLLANNPPLYRHFMREGASRAWEAEEFQDALSVRLSLEDEPLSELEQDQFAYRAAISTILRTPAIFIISCIYRVGWLWALWPHDGSFGIAESLIAIWYAGVFCFAYIGFRQLWRKRAMRNWLVGLLLVLSLTAIHAVFWSNMRMRAPAMPCMMLLAVVSLSTSLSRRDEAR